MVMRRYGRLATLFWTQVKQIVDLQIVFYFIYAQFLAFGISIYGRRYICTYIGNICWYLYYFFPSSESGETLIRYSNAVSHWFLRVCLRLTVAKVDNK